MQVRCGLFQPHSEVDYSGSIGQTAVGAGHLIQSYGFAHVLIIAAVDNVNSVKSLLGPMRYERN